MDASNSGIGAMMTQKYEGKLHPVAYSSKKLTNAETKLKALKECLSNFGNSPLKECLAIIRGVEKFCLFLAGKKLQIDHKPLSFSVRLVTKNHRILRWFLSLQEYDFIVKDSASKNNVMADYPSRMIV